MADKRESRSSRRPLGSGGSRAANANGAPRKHAAFHSRRPTDRKARLTGKVLAGRSELREGLRRRGQALARKAAVVVHLPHQRLDGSEFHFFAQEGDEGDIQAASIEFAVEIKQIYLK